MSDFKLDFFFLLIPCSASTLSTSALDYEGPWYGIITLILSKSTQPLRVFQSSPSNFTNNFSKVWPLKLDILWCQLFQSQIKRNVSPATFCPCTGATAAESRSSSKHSGWLGASCFPSASSTPASAISAAPQMAAPSPVAL